jgi:hypothetical protein
MEKILMKLLKNLEEGEDLAKMLMKTRKCFHPSSLTHVIQDVTNIA